MTPLCRRLPALTCLLVSLLPARAAVGITFAAGPHPRHATPATFARPASLPPAGWLREASGREFPYQSDPDGRAWLLVPDLAPGAKLHCTAIERPTPPPAVVQARSGDHAAVTTDPFVDLFLTDGAGGPAGRVLRYQGQPGEFPYPGIRPIYRRGGYIQSVFSPSGRLVSDDFPPNHTHHHGIWSPWTRTTFAGRAPDFWNMGEGTGRVEFVGLDAVWSGPVHGGLRSRHRFIDSTTRPEVAALDETWELRVFARPEPTGNAAAGNAAARPGRIFDLTITQTCATATPLQLLEYHYGGLGFRGHRDWDGTNNWSVLTSEGLTNRVQANGTRGRWCHLGGQVEGAFTGLAILCHPDNFRAPQPMRVHPSEPFFCFAPPQLGAFAIEPGRPYVARYRFIVADGPPDAAELDRLWQDFATPPRVSVAPE